MTTAKRAFAWAGLLRFGLVIAPVFGSAACQGGTAKELSGEALKDPESCRSCHAEHVTQWSGSMHAYAGEDPVFLAMNAQAQRESNGAVGDFCVKCHAPVAWMEGATKDGTNLAELPAYLRGVTCYFCHSVESVEGSHNNPLKLATDNVLRGPISDPIENPAHASGYSALHDRDRRASANLCGSCHDIVTPGGAHIERTFSEWKASQFGSGDSSLVTCGNCHMAARKAPAADFDGVPLREVHDHAWPGVDVALTPFPQMAEQRMAVEKALSQTVIGQLCVTPPLGDLSVDVVLENAFAGHAFPSGAAAERRVWAEVVGYAGDARVFESGAAIPGEPIATLADPNLLLFRDRHFDANGDETHAFWKAKTYESNLLLPRPAPDHRRTTTFHLPLTNGTPDRVTVRLFVRPIDSDVLDPLVASGDLDPAIVDAVPTFLAHSMEWKATDGFGCTPKDAFSP